MIVFLNPCWLLLRFASSFFFWSDCGWKCWRHKFFKIGIRIETASRGYNQNSQVFLWLPGAKTSDSAIFVVTHTLYFIKNGGFFRHKRNVEPTNRDNTVVIDASFLLNDCCAAITLPSRAIIPNYCNNDYKKLRRTPRRGRGGGRVKRNGTSHRHTFQYIPFNALECQVGREAACSYPDDS